MRHASRAGGLLLLAMSCAPAFAADSLVAFWSAVRQSDPRLQMARVREDVAHARAQKGLSTLLPQAAAQVSRTRTGTERNGPVALGGGRNDYNGERYALSLQQPLLDIPHWRGYQADKALVEQTDQESLRALGDLRLEALERYLDAAIAGERLRLARQEEETAEAQALRIRALQERQLAKVTDALLAEARRDGLHARRLRAEAELQVALGALSTLAGGEAVMPRSLDESQPLPLLDPALAGWQQRASSQNTDLLARQAAEARFTLLLSSERARHLPTLSVQASTQDTNIGYDNFFSPRTSSGVFGITLSVPLYQGGGQQAAVHEALGELHLAELESAQAHRRLELAVREALLLAQGLHAQADAAQVVVSSTEKALAASERGYQVGAATLGEVFDARRDVFSARRDQAEVRLEYLRQWARLLRTCEELDDVALRTVDRLLRVEVPQGL